ncbi:hypothetical protein [Geothrix sp. 21YS21S-4]|uniref:hypothetical protein n=1 Tax=Geothrix sp. 21YS21S-4 TaxID=3068889 RepID=UPI0027BADCCE|nr:hypothetical protein [Geothrix sp. 21YS21S-4]
MDINAYLHEIEHALGSLLGSIWHDHERAQKLREEILHLKELAEDQYRRAEFTQMNAMDSEDLMDGVGLYWDTYFGPDKDQHYKSISLEELEKMLEVREFSISALSGNVLQLAKQGLSLAYGSPSDWPSVRQIGSQTLAAVILQARNQTEHWEEGNPKPKVVICFDALTAEMGPEFSRYREKNLAFEVISLLGWHTLEDFNRDFQTTVATNSD